MGNDNVERLKNYYNLLAKVDELCRRVTAECGEHLACRAGCAGCCKHLSLFPVEAAALATALDALPEDRAGHIRVLAGAATAAACPLLENGRCLLYAARPIICRTHGLPLLTGQGEEQRIDYCPENFKGTTSLPADAVLNLDLLNTTLAAINAVFTATEQSGQERLSIAEALLLIDT
jgi:uncharacterized protein